MKIDDNRIINREKYNFLYIGGFELPDKNAAAHRVINIAKALNDLGHEVYFLNYTDSIKKPSWKKYYGFSCYENRNRSMWAQLVDIADVISVVKEKQISHIIAYNFPSIAFLRLLKYCRLHNIKCYADATEWYISKGKFIYSWIKTLDSNFRMKNLHMRTDGVIAISDYLYKYYKDKVCTVKIPPVVSISDSKWKQKNDENVSACPESLRTVFIYAGQPSSTKERLDRIVEAVEKTSRPAILQIIGITQKQYEDMYHTCYHGTKTNFIGRISHEEVIHLLKKADWSIIVRENNKVVKAGFPTKVVESISCGTPVIANRFSNIEEYLDESNSILCDIDSLDKAIYQACGKRLSVKKDIFDYHRFLNEMQDLIK